MTKERQIRKKSIAEERKGRSKAIECKWIHKETKYSTQWQKSYM